MIKIQGILYCHWACHTFYYIPSVHARTRTRLEPAVNLEYYIKEALILEGKVLNYLP